MAKTEADISSATVDSISTETAVQSPLYFFPDHEISAEELRQILSGDDPERRVWAISNILRYAQWEDIWTLISRDEVRSLFDLLDLPEKLRAAYARMLQIPRNETGRA